MKSAAPKKATVTALHRAEAKKLHAIWVARGKPKQGQMGKDFKIGGQSAVGNFLNGHSALSLEAAQGFARALKCDIAEFSPRLAAKAASLGSVAGLDARVMDITRLSPEEVRLVMMYRDMGEDGQLEVDRVANLYYVQAHPERVSSANPWGLSQPGEPPQTQPSSQMALLDSPRKPKTPPKR